MWCANTRYTARRDFPAFGDEAQKKLRVFIVDVVDLVDAEPAHFFSPEVLLLGRGDGFVATGGRCEAAIGRPLR